MLNYSKVLIDSIEREKRGIDYIYPKADKELLHQLLEDINSYAGTNFQYLAELDTFNIHGVGSIVAKYITEFSSEGVKGYLIPQVVSDKTKDCDKLILQLYMHFRSSDEYIAKPGEPAPAHIYVRYDNAFRTLKPKRLAKELMGLAHSPRDAYYLPFTMRMLASWKIPEMKMYLTELMRVHIKNMYITVAEKSHRMAQIVKNIMNTSMRYAVNKGLITDNPATDVPLPKCVAQKAYHTRTIEESNTLNLEQIVILINASRGTGIYMQVLFAVLMGLRRGEINGLKYGDIDFIRQKLHVSRQLGRAANSDDIVFSPKTRTKQEIKLKTLSSDRVLDIPDFVFEEILKSREQYERNRSRRSKTFQDLDYICCSNYGRPRSMQYHFKPFKEILQKNGLPDIRWHDLRHSYATLLMKNDFNLKATSKILGHAKEIVTADIYVDNQENIDDGVGELKEYMDEVVPQRPTDFNEKERVFDYSDFDVTAAFDDLTL